MNVPYKNLRPSIFEKLDELVAAGRTMPAACTELRSMIRDGAVILLDLHDPGKTDEWLRQGAFTLIDAVRQNSKTLAGDWKYFKNVAVIDWAEIDKAVGAAISEVSEKDSAATDQTGDCLISPRLPSEEECEKLIVALKSRGLRLKKADVLKKAKDTLPDLRDKEFDRAWKKTAGDWTKRGRPKNPPKPPPKNPHKKPPI
jgi:hypothetical protein